MHFKQPKFYFINQWQLLKMLWKTLAKPHEQSGLYKYKISKHASELKKTKLYVQRAYNLISTKNTFQKCCGNINWQKAVEQVAWLDRAVSNA